MFFYRLVPILLFLSLIYGPVRAQTADTVRANQYYESAESLSEQGKYQEASQLFRKAQHIYEEAEYWEKYIACLNSIAYNLWPIAAYDSATAMAEQALGRFRDQIAPLRFNQKEAISIGQHLSGVSLTNQFAVERRFKKEASQYSILHLAMHALVDDQDPMHSRLVFSQDATDTLEDGFLHAYELYSMDLSADLAVLSACETGYGKMERGEGIMSLARAFAYAGCPSIVMSHWTVDDAASAKLMDHFYRYLSEGLSKDEALRQAKLTFLEDASVQEANPFFWGNFVVIGDVSPIVDVRPVWVYWLLGGSGILLVVLLFVYLFRLRSVAHL